MKTALVQVAPSSMTGVHCTAAHAGPVLSTSGGSGTPVAQRRALEQQNAATGQAVCNATSQPNSVSATEPAAYIVFRHFTSHCNRISGWLSAQTVSSLVKRLADVIEGHLEISVEILLLQDPSMQLQQALKMVEPV